MARSEAEVEAVAKALADGASGCSGGCERRPCEVDYRDAELIVGRLDACRAEAAEVERLRAEIVALDKANEGLGEEVVRLRRRAEAAPQRDEITPEEASNLLVWLEGVPNVSLHGPPIKEPMDKLRRLAPEDPS